MYLSPRDLLQLSRLSKQFRSIFASRLAIFVWRTAFCNVNRKCLEDLNELQFASLLYDRCCMVQPSFLSCTTVHDHFFFLLGMRTCYDEMPTIHHAPSEIMSKLSKWKVRILSILILYCPKSLLTNPHGVFAALLLPVIYEINTKTLGTSFPACLLACFGLGSVLQARSPTTYRKVPIFEKGKLSKVYCQCTAAYQVQTRSKYHFTTKHSKVNETQSSSFFLGLL